MRDRESDEGPQAPLPPDDLNTRDIRLLVLAVPGVVSSLFRVHWPGRALLFGPEPGNRPRGRFDAPDKQYQVHYSGFSFTAAVVEALLRQEQSPILTKSDLAVREITTLRLHRPLRVAPLFGKYLRRLGATAAVASGPYSASRLWGLALWELASQPDGIVYPSRHDDSKLCLALFNRAADALDVVSTKPLTTRLDAILKLRRRYRFPLDLDE